MLKAGLVDTLKGSYYANINPAIDTFNVSSAQRQDYPEYYGENICVCSYHACPVGLVQSALTLPALAPRAQA